MLHTGTIFYLTTRIAHYSDGFAWQQAAQIAALFQCAVSRAARLLVQSIAVSIRFLIIVFKSEWSYTTTPYAFMSCTGKNLPSRETLCCVP